MNKEELSLLLYLETRAVDHRGRVDHDKMNDDDREILQRWSAAGFVRTGRICFDDILKNVNERCSTWISLSDEAFAAAHQERLSRARRTWEDKKYMTTDEKRCRKKPG